MRKPKYSVIVFMKVTLVKPYQHICVRNPNALIWLPRLCMNWLLTPFIIPTLFPFQDFVFGILSFLCLFSPLSTPCTSPKFASTQMLFSFQDSIQSNQFQIIPPSKLIVAAKRLQLKRNSFVAMALTSLVLSNNEKAC